MRYLWRYDVHDCQTLSSVNLSSIDRRYAGAHLPGTAGCRCPCPSVDATMSVSGANQDRRPRRQLNEQTVRRAQVVLILMVLAAGVVAYFVVEDFRAELQILGGIATHNDINTLHTY